MFQHVLEVHPLVGVLPEQLDDEVPGRAGDVGREPEVDVDDPLVGVLVGLGLEWRFADQELVGEDAECPVVHPLVVGLTLDHLRRKIVQGPAHGGPSAAGGVHGPAKVGDLEVALHVQKKILWLDVSVDHLHRVTVTQGLEM